LQRVWFSRLSLRRLLLIGLLGLAGGLMEWFIITRQPPQYEATATLLVNPGSPSALIPYLGQSIVGGTSPLPTLAASYGVYLRSRTFTEMATPQLNTSASPGQLAYAIHTGLISNTNMFQLSVRWDSPTEAARLANGVANIFINARRPPPTSPLDTAVVSTEYYRRRVEALRLQWEEVRDSPNLTPDQKQEAFERLLSVLTPSEESYARWSQIAAQNEAARQSGVDTATLLEPAVPPGTPLGPSLRRSVLLGTAVGLALGVALALLLERLDDTVKTGEDVARVAQLPTLGSVGRLGRSRLLGRQNTRSPVAEAYRIVRTNIRFATAARDCRTILVTSPGHGEGKSTTAANLAIVTAQAGKRVILVDSDLRRPSVHRLFGTASSPGLGDLLRDEAATSSTALLRPTWAEGLRLLTAGSAPPDAAELLQGPRFARVLQELRDACDLVFLDSPPLLEVADAAVLGAQVDGVVLVVEAGKTRAAAVQHSVATLDHAGASVLGSVVNKRSPWVSGGHYYWPSGANNGLPSPDGAAVGAGLPTTRA
jgi:non-specific protein-tyrosine kinase